MSTIQYRFHVFLCTYQRMNGKACCAEKNARSLLDYMKKTVKKLYQADIRINAAGCLDQCKKGPVMVIYPQGVWYHYRNEKDIDEIIQQHLVEGNIVKRLLLQS